MGCESFKEKYATKSFVLYNWIITVRFMYIVFAASKSSKRNIINPCIPRGYEYPQISNASYVKRLIFQPAGNFSTCRSEALSLLKRTEGCIMFSYFTVLA